VVTARRAERLTRLAAELPRAVAVPGDAADPHHAAQVVDAAQAAFGRIDALVNNAGGIRDRTLLKMTDDEFGEVVGAHVHGTFYMARACARVMREQGDGGTVINIGSDSGLLGAFGQTNYAAAKGAVLGLTLTWAQELPRYGITCNGVLPNALTAMTERLPDLLERYHYGRFPSALGDPEQVAPLIVLLASERGRALNGRLLSLGGDKLSLWRPPDEHRSAYLGGGWSLDDLAGTLELALDIDTRPTETGSPHGTAHP
jgi:NAD(P)-dependent dehydrogenase (short-subunit alcohol dehydrogenase family)